MRIKELIFNPKSKYIVITFFTSAIGFLKSFLVLKNFNLDELGILTLCQTLITTISLMQIGVITGGYRLYSYKNPSVLKGVNSSVLIFFITLSTLLLFLGLMANILFDIRISFSYLFSFIIIGIISLYSNWAICQLLATKNVHIVNKAQLWANITSFGITVSSLWLGFEFVIVGLLIQPMILIGMSYFYVPELIPHFNFRIFKKYTYKIISVGFVPYLTSAMSLLNSQLGRWIITFSLGTIILGRIYLVTLFVTLVSIFPNAISSLFFPSIIEKYEKKMVTDLKGTLKKYFYVLNIYFALIIIFTLSLINVVVSTFLQNHVESINLVYATLPSLLFLSLSNPAIILFNAGKKFNYILTGSIIMVLSYCVLVIIYLIFFQAQLLGFFIIESISSFIFFIYNIYYFIKLNKSN